MKNIQIFLVEDSPEFREVLAFGLDSEPDMDVVGQFNTADAALRSISALTPECVPDLILLDLNLPGISGLEAIPRFKMACPQTEILVLTQSDKKADILSAISHGAVGYLLKESSMSQLTEGVRSIMDGGSSLDPVMARYVLNKQSGSGSVTAQDLKLSTRELQILELLAEGEVQKEIADQLGIRPKTVGFHLGHLYTKLEVNNAPAAVHKAHSLGLLIAKE
ncbi:response regulator transcription factor [Akkermansiaceae bacterium]|nr:response regulator transcription factor [Akkermansiaceae bacterium]